MHVCSFLNIFLFQRMANEMIIIARQMEYLDILEDSMVLKIGHSNKHKKVAIICLLS